MTSSTFVTIVGVTGEVAALVEGCDLCDLLFDDRVEIEGNCEVDGVDVECSLGFGTLSYLTMFCPRVTSAFSKL